MIGRLRTFFDLLIAMDGGEDAVDELAVELLVLRHLVHLLPLLFAHVLLDLLRGELLSSDVVASSSEHLPSHEYFDQSLDVSA